MKIAELLDKVSEVSTRTDLGKEAIVQCCGVKYEIDDVQLDRSGRTIIMVGLDIFTRGAQNAR